MGRSSPLWCIFLEDSCILGLRTWLNLIWAVRCDLNPDWAHSSKSTAWFILSWDILNKFPMRESVTIFSYIFIDAIASSASFSFNMMLSLRLVSSLFCLVYITIISWFFNFLSSLISMSLCFSFSLKASKVLVNLADLALSSALRLEIFLASSRCLCCYISSFSVFAAIEASTIC